MTCKGDGTYDWAGCAARDGEGGAQVDPEGPSLLIGPARHIWRERDVVVHLVASRDRARRDYESEYQFTSREWVFGYIPAVLGFLSAIFR